MLHSILIYEVCFCRYLLDVNLDMRALCAINRKVPSVSVAAHNNSQGANMTFSILTFADRAARQSSPSFLESRSIYANLHGYSLRMFFHKLDVSREFVWSKLPGVHEVLFGRGSSTWVWVVDLDTLIFNFGVKLESFVQAAEADAKRRSKIRRFRRIFYSGESSDSGDISMQRRPHHLGVPKIRRFRLVQYHLLAMIP